jgi:hypothetical protein
MNEVAFCTLIISISLVAIVAIVGITIYYIGKVR